MLKTRPIFVESRMRVDLDELWRRTQTPDLHERWDLRFTDIKYLPRPDPLQPQRFLYATRIGFGMRISGEGESVGEHLGPDERSSALKFWSEDPKSLINNGSGYWKYIRTGDGVRFLTRYDYEVRFGSLGRLIDRALFRPLLGWATAWGFDCLRLWIEKGMDPADTRERALTYAVCRLTLALVWVYQGVVPKILFMEHSGELETISKAPVPQGWEENVLLFAGAAEVLFGVTMIVLWRWRSLLLLNIIGLAALALSVVWIRVELFHREFNPATLNASMIALATVGWLSSRRELPSARNCLRETEGPS